DGCTAGGRRRPHRLLSRPRGWGPKRHRQPPDRGLPRGRGHLLDDSARRNGEVTNVKTGFRNATVIAMSDRTSPGPIHADVLVDGDAIAAIGPDLDLAGADRVIEAHELLLMPGMVNAHIHTEQNTFRGRYPGLPLEVLM